MTLLVTLDLFGTLIRADGDYNAMWESLTLIGYPCSPEVEAIWNSHGWDGESTPPHVGTPYAEWRSECIRSLARQVGVPAKDVEAVANELLAAESLWRISACQGAVELCESLLEHGIPTCVCSNWDYDVEPFLAQAGLPVLPAVTSATCGWRKPNWRIFAAAAEHVDGVGLPHVHVGDSWTADVVGALRYGADPIWLTDRAMPAGADPRVQRAPSLDKVWALLSQRLI
jgi:FMN phosphatase YigB (HAD superfamily)